MRVTGPKIQNESNVIPFPRASSSEIRLVNFEFAVGRAAAIPDLEAIDVHLWHASPDEAVLGSHPYKSLLSTDELHRMSRFRYEPDQRFFAFARGMLRSILAQYLSLDPKDVRFSYAQHGKPSLAPPQSQANLEFNLSHTAGYVLLGISRGRKIGVDVERLRENFEVAELAARFFSAVERRAIARLRNGPQRQAFFHCWTRKEAFLKAQGGGLLLPLENFDVTVRPNESSIKLITRPNPEEAERWRIINVPVPSAYAAAVAVSC